MSTTATKQTDLPTHEVIELYPEPPDAHWRLLNGDTSWREPPCKHPNPQQFSMGVYDDLRHGRDYWYSRHSTGNWKEISFSRQIRREDLERWDVFGRAKVCGVTRIEITRNVKHRCWRVPVTLVTLWRQNGKCDWEEDDDARHPWGDHRVV